jgi:hypothetical protein
MKSILEKIPYVSFELVVLIGLFERFEMFLALVLLTRQRKKYLIIMAKNTSAEYKYSNLLKEEVYVINISC